MVLRSRFLCFLWFSGGFDPRSARARAIETQFAISGVASKGVSFSLQFGGISDTFGVGISQKGTSKSSLKTKAAQVCVFLHSGSFGHPFGPHMGGLFLPLGRGCPQKGKVFSSLGPWNFKRWCLTSSGATGASDISCFLESGP